MYACADTCASMHWHPNTSYSTCFIQAHTHETYIVQIHQALHSLQALLLCNLVKAAVTSVVTKNNNAWTSTSSYGLNRGFLVGCMFLGWCLILVNMRGGQSRRLGRIRHGCVGVLWLVIQNHIPIVLASKVCLLALENTCSRRWCGRNGDQRG